MSVDDGSKGTGGVRPPARALAEGAAAVRQDPQEKERLRAWLREVLATEVARRGEAIEAQEELVDEVLAEVTGFGPLEPLLAMPGVSDILVNGPDEVYIERQGMLEPTDVRFRNEAQLRAVIQQVASWVGRRVDEKSPMVDARLPDGSRVNAVLPPAAVDAPMLSIRRFDATGMNRAELVRRSTMPDEMMQLLEGCIKAKMNILISGGTGSGKTTLLNVLSAFIPANERVITIEDAAELHLQQKHVIRLETRPPDVDGEGEIVARDLVRNALRMRPDRIIVGETRGPEALDMLQAMNTGHQGSLSTLHANSSRHALARMQSLVSMAAPTLTPRAAREMISEALQLVVQIARMPDGSRRLVAITEITGMEGDVISTQDVFRFRQTTIDQSGRVRGRFESTGIRPVFASRLAEYGIEVPRAFLSLNVDV